MNTQTPRASSSRASSRVSIVSDVAGVALNGGGDDGGGGGCKCDLPHWNEYVLKSVANVLLGRYILKMYAICKINENEIKRKCELIILVFSDDYESINFGRT